MEPMDYCKNCKRWTCGAQGTTHGMSIPCGNYIPPTNADKIRQMTDEELADFIGGIFTIERDMWGDYDHRTVVTQGPRVEVRNKEDMLDWLKQEVESDG